MSRERMLMVAAWLTGCGLVGWMLLYRLGSLVGGFSSSEQFLPTRHAILHNMLHNPLNAPLNILRLVVSLTPYHGLTASRLPNAILGLLTILLFSYLMRLWYGPRTAVYGTVMLAVSGWFLHMSRIATSDILYPLALIALLLLPALLHRSESRMRTWLVPLIIVAVAYIPGMVWFVLLSVAWQRADYGQAWVNLGSGLQRIIWLLLWPLGLSLLLYGFWRTPHLLTTWVGLPGYLDSPLKLLHNFGAVWAHIFVRGPQSPQLGLGFLPLINTFTSAMAIVGGYFYVRHWRAPRSRMLASVLLVGAVGAALGGPVSVGVLLPIVILLAGGGLGYLLHDWLKTFPRNPIARGLGFGLVGVALGFSALYNLHQYYIAWPHNPSIRSAFQRYQ